MNTRMIGFVLGRILLVEAGLLALPLADGAAVRGTPDAVAGYHAGFGGHAAGR